MSRRKELKKMQLLICISMFTVSLVNCQFYYNYEENADSDLPSGSQLYDETTPHNPPSRVNRRYPQPKYNTTENNERGTFRTRVKVRARSTSPESGQIQLEEDRQAVRQQRRQNRRKQRQEFENLKFNQSPRIYSPSIFENVPLGEAPSGVYIPQDSLLNVLRNSETRISKPIQQTYPQAASFARNELSGFIQPESNNAPSFYIPETGVSTSGSADQKVSRTPPVQIRRTKQHFAPTVDIDSLREHMDQVDNEEIEVVSHVQYAMQEENPPSRRRRINYFRTKPIAKVNSLSAFDDFSLGEAPEGVYIPKDSLLNVLRQPNQRPQEIRVNTQFQEPLSQNERQFQSGYDSDENECFACRNASKRPRNRQSVQTVHQAESSQTRNPTKDYERSRPVQNERTSQLQRPKPKVKVQQVSAPRREESKAPVAIAVLPDDTDNDGIPGESGVDYPTLHVIPRTSFSCTDHPHNGYYADLETSCQVVHLCQSRGVQDSFLCPNGTIFSQEKFSCQWWYKVNCNDAPKFYKKNDELYKIPEKPERRRG